MDEKEVQRKGKLTKSIEKKRDYISEYSLKQKNQVISLSLAIAKLQNYQHYSEGLDRRIMRGFIAWTAFTHLEQKNAWFAWKSFQK